jgi:hypothetical protein
MASRTSTSFIETMQDIDAIQIKTEITEKIWNTIGTAIILLVEAKKSAEASMQSIAFFKDWYPQQSEIEKIKQTKAATMNAPRDFLIT